MNLFLKLKIIEKFGTQGDFAQTIKVDETLVSKIIRGRRTLDPEKQHIWARALDCVPEDIFKENRS